MKRPRQVWLIYGLLSCGILIGCGWFTARLLVLEQEQRLAELQADQEERIRLALWRMDSLIIPVIATEATRSPAAYQIGDSLLATGGGLPTSSPYVLLNFQLDRSEGLSSPNSPVAALQQTPPLAPSDQAPADLAVLRQELDFDDVLQQLPDEYVVTATTPGLNEFVINANAYLDNDRDGDGRTDSLIDGEKGLKTGDYVGRSALLKNTAQQSLAQQYGNGLNDLQQRQSEPPQSVIFPAATDEVRIGTSRPLWLEQHLVLLRRVSRAGETVIQGTWLNWPVLQRDLQREVEQVLPGGTLRPLPGLTPGDPGRTLASLPVELLPPALSLRNWYANPQLGMLGLAWLGLLLAVGTVGYLLFAVMSLSERRAAFVSAVTHELRTPLTTFQLYTDMLAEGVVQQPEQQREYLETLRDEAVRLSHLVENVLAYARLENRPTANGTTLSVGELFERLRPGLMQRSRQARLELDWPTDLPDALVHVDASIVEQILQNLIDNAGKYARREGQAMLTLSVAMQQRSVAIDVRDDGPGIDAAVQPRLFQPFSKSDHEAAATAPGVGLGLALSRGLARQQQGDLQLVSTSPSGTCFRLLLPRG
ncbi:MAG: HAMP domain-containing histidine kinase [Planctomycetaceae bacterium]|nr:HAMP domain-containing histidine kinase [Planctomycetaceae bacterium]